MLKKIFSLLIIVFALFSTFAFAEDMEQNAYFPLTKGNFWVYKLSNMAQVRFEATGTEQKNGKTFFVLTSYPAQDFENIQKEYYLSEENGLYYYGKQLKNLNAIYTPLFKELPTSLSAPQTWEWTGTVSNIKTRITSSCAGAEDYKFGDKTFKAYKVTQTITEDGQKDPANKIVITRWYVKNIGKVKEVSEQFNGKESYIITAIIESYGVK